MLRDDVPERQLQEHGIFRRGVTEEVQRQVRAVRIHPAYRPVLALEIADNARDKGADVVR